MITIESIKNQIDKIEALKKARQAYNDGMLKINWETDICKMDFLKLKSQPIVNRVKARIESTEVPIVSGMEIKSDTTFDEMMDIGGRASMLDLLQIVMSDTKVIPPVSYNHYFVVDGVKEFNYPARDGAHRMLLSRFIGLKEIPMVVEDTLLGYKFSPEKWTFSVENETLVVSAVNSDEVHRFNVSDYVVYEFDEDFIYLMPIK